MSSEDLRHSPDTIADWAQLQNQPRASNLELNSSSSAVLATKPKTSLVDMRSLEYVGSYDHNLMCAICHCPFLEPVKLDCDHLFCRSCVTLALMHQEKDVKCCPTCRRKTSQISIAPVPKIINHMLDELLVYCPSRKAGCDDKMARGTVENHIGRYCSFSEVECPSDRCSMTIKRKDAGQKRCLHNTLHCDYCHLLFMERDLESHKSMHCSLRQASCPHCATEVPYPDLEKHVRSCPEAITPCTAAPYGCDFTSKNASMEQHTATCPLVKLVPFLKLQNDRLAAHESALNHIRQKNILLEDSFSTIQQTLKPSYGLLDTNITLPNPPSERRSPFDSTAHHLLCLHESLREEIARVSAAVSELDAKTSMMVLNESLRTKEELAHTNAAVGGMRMHLHWLMSARLQNQQRDLIVRGGMVGSSGGDGGPGGSAVGGAGGLPVRRLSDTARQDTKL